MSHDELNNVKQQAIPLFTEEDVASALDRMAATVDEKFADQTPLLICVMNGGIVVTGHLLTRLTIHVQVDFVHVTRYQGATTGGDLKWRVEPNQNLQGRRVILVDDIFDEGNTLAAIVEHCQQRGAIEIYTAVLVDKKHDRKVKGLRPDLIGFEVDDHYVFGFGMDYHEYFRNLPGIYAIS